MQHVRAGDVDEGERFVLLPRMREDVVQMVGAIEVEGRIGIARQTVTTGMHEVEVQREVFVNRVQRGQRHQQQSREGEDCEFVHDCFPWIFFSSPSSVYSTNERSLSAHCPTFDPGELTPSNCDKQSGISSSTNTNYVNMWD